MRVKVSYRQFRGNRIKRYAFYGLMVDYYNGDSQDAKRVWWSRKLKKWCNSYDAVAPYSNTHHVRSVKAAVKHLRKYGVPGYTYILVSRWVGYEVYFKVKENR